MMANSTSMARYALLMSVLLFGGQCKPTEPIQPVANDCLLTSIVTKETMPGTTLPNNDQNRQTTYEYDANKRLTRKKQLDEYREAGKMISGFTSETSYVYDTDGYLVNQVSQSKTTDQDGKVYAYTRRVVFSYTNGRLTRREAELTDQGRQTSEVTTYNYTAAGEIQTQLDETTDRQSGVKTGATWTYQNGKLTDYVTRNALGRESRPYTISEGRIIRQTSDFSVIENTYDTQGRIIQFAVRYSADNSFLYTFAYSTDRLANQPDVEVFKGFPVTQPIYGEPGLLSKVVYYVLDSGKNAKQSESTYRHKISGTGRLLETEEQQTHYRTEQAQTKTVTQTFTYSNNCQ